MNIKDNNNFDKIGTPILDEKGNPILVAETSPSDKPDIKPYNNNVKNVVPTNYKSFKKENNKNENIIQKVQNDPVKYEPVENKHVENGPVKFGGKRKTNKRRNKKTNKRRNKKSNKRKTSKK
jgi:hypothetical protein